MKWKLVLIIHIAFTLNAYSQQTVGLFEFTEDVYPGYTLFSTNSEMVYLIDNCGYEINSWKVEARGAGPSYLLKNGELLKLSRVSQSSFNAGGAQGKLEKYSWDGTLLWSADYDTDQYIAHHDIYPMENGNILLIAWERKADQEVEALGRTVIPINGLWSETVVEIEPIGTDDFEIVWKWDIMDHTVQNEDNTLENYGAISENPQLLDINKGILMASDWLHFNSIDYNEELDQIILSSRSMNEIYIIDHSTTTQEAASHTGGLSGKGGDILYRWGNPRNYNSGTLTDQKFFGQHNARWIEENPSSAGNITAFNNGAGIPEGENYSTIIEIEPSLNGYNYDLENNKFLPENPAWEYKADPAQNFYSARISSAQRMPNDNTFINQGLSGRLFEVNQEGDIVWEYYNPVATNGPMTQGNFTGNTDLFKAMKYGVNDGRLSGKDLSPKGPIELDPLMYDCSTSSTAPLGYKQIRVSNPVSDLLTIWSDVDVVDQVDIYTLDGQKLNDFTILNTSTIDISHLRAGIYILRYKEFSYKIVKV